MQLILLKSLVKLNSAMDIKVYYGQTFYEGISKKEKGYTAEIWHIYEGKLGLSAAIRNVAILETYGEKDKFHVYNTLKI